MTFLDTLKDAYYIYNCIYFLNDSAVKGCENMMEWLFGAVAKNFNSATKEVVKESSHNINRRIFLNLMTSGVMVYLAKDLIYPEIASANDDIINEKYHVFIPYEIAKRGGIQKVALRSGNICQVKIPPRVNNISKKEN